MKMPPNINFDDLRDLAPQERPKCLDVWTLLGDFWRKPTGAVILLFLCAVVLASTIISFLQGHWWLRILFLTLGGVVVSLGMTASICRGVVSSNWGTFFAGKEPVRYGVGLLLYMAVYVVLIWPLLSYIGIGF